jgi:excisionase family DNA binding protein
MQTTASDYDLVTLDVAIARYRGVSLRTARNWIRDGKLLATKAGRSYLIAPSDLAALLRPVVRAPAERATRETPSEREERQLAAAGIGRPSA